MKIFKNLAGIILAASFVFASCSTAIGSSSDDSSENSGQKSQAYGSLTISDENSSRALDVSALTNATVTVSGYGMTDITKSGVEISSGKASTTIENIPTGKNRVVTVKSNVDGATLRAVCDIKAGENSVTVNWNTTAAGSVFYYLIKKGKDVSDIAATAFDSAIPSDVHASLVNAEAIASDYPSLKDASSYVSDYGSVSVTSSSASGYTVQVTDIASEKKTISGSNDSFDLVAYPGTWKVWVLDSTGTKVAEKDITVVSGETSYVDVKYGEGGEYDFIGKTIAFVKAASVPHIWAWEEGGVALSEKLGGAWNSSSSATLMTAVPSTYMKDTSDWYMIDYSSYATGKTIKFQLNWNNGTTYTGAAGTFWYDSTSSGSATTTNPSPASSEASITLTVNSPVPPVEAVKIYVSASSAPSIWVWQPDGLESTKLMGYTWNSQPTMSAATGLKYNSGWYVLEIGGEYYTEGKAFSFILNSGSNIVSAKTTTFWYDAAGLCGSAGTYYDSDPTTVPEPVLPTVKIKPATGSKIPANGTITVTLTNGNDTITNASVILSGAVSKSYSYSSFSGNVLSIKVEDLGVSEGSAISVSASVTNSVGTANDSSSLTVKEAAKEDPFTWDNVNAYFVLTDRFYNGDTSNDHSYNRKNDLSGSENVATFHGGDIAGLTQKLDYFVDLGVNAIWITAPYEQVHGWVSGKGHKFPHYAFHGYYTLDWTAMDQNMGTLEELRTFVNACHSKGIRVIMDVVMNHVGYNNQEDMITYPHGKTDITEHGWLEKVTASCGDGCSLNHTNCYFANYTVEWTNSYWESWWGPWISSFAYDRGAGEGGSCGGLPDVRSELTESVGMAPVMVTKWKTDSDSIKSAYYNPSVANADWNGYSGDYRTDKGIAPMDYQVVWLSAWVRELGIDGFRCDTAKHVERWRWGQLKVACQAALEAWRDDSSKDKTYNGVDTGAADWDENFWMTAECFGWTATDGTNSDYYQTGKFDSVINFSFNKSAKTNTTSDYPNENTWSSYLSINSNPDYDSNGNRNNVLTYVSSHDTALCRASNQYEVGTMLTLLPGGVQIYYGDESNRGQAYTDCGDSDMMTRGDMDFSNTNLIAHWGKVGKFRKYNPAVGAGTGTANKRTYSGSAGENSVAISLSSTTVDVSGLFADGTTVYNWYDGKSATVSGGSVTFSSSSASTSAPVLVSDKNPASYGVTF